MSHVPERLLVWEIDYLPSLDMVQFSPITLPFPSPGTFTETLYLSTRTFSTAPDDTPPNQLYDGVILDPGTINHDVFASSGTSGRGTSNYGFIEIANVNGEFDFLYDASFGWPAYLKILGPDSLRIDEAMTLMQVVVIGIESDDALRTLRFRIRDPMTVLDNPLLSERYAGTGGAEGGSALTGRIKPLVLGRVSAVPAILIDDTNLIYQVSKSEVVYDTVRDGGLGLTQFDDVADYAALAAYAFIPPGNYVAASPVGMFRLSSAAAFEITVRCFGQISGSDYTAGSLIYEILTEWMGIDPSEIDLTSIGTLIQWNNAFVGIYVNDERSAIDVISYLADTVGGALIYSFRQGTGQFRTIFIYSPEGVLPSPPIFPGFDSPDYYGEILTYTLDNVVLSGFTLSLNVNTPASEGEGRPVWQVIIKYGRIWHPLDIAGLAAAVAESDSVNIFTTEWSEVSAYNLNLTGEFGLAAVFGLLPSAATITYETAFDTATGAQNEADRRIDIYGRRRDRLVVPFSFAEDPDFANHKLGDQILFSMSRFGYDTAYSPLEGKPFLVIGRKDDFKARVRTLTLWG